MVAIQKVLKILSSPSILKLLLEILKKQGFLANHFKQCYAQIQVVHETPILKSNFRIIVECGFWREKFEHFFPDQISSSVLGLDPILSKLSMLLDKIVDFTVVSELYAETAHTNIHQRVLSGNGSMRHPDPMQES